MKRAHGNGGWQRADRHDIVAMHSFGRVNESRIAMQFISAATVKGQCSR